MGRRKHRPRVRMILALSLVLSHSVDGLISSSSDLIQYIPSKIIATDITKYYPTTLVSKLFSSVPKRQNAIDHITLELIGGDDGCSGPILLLGNSSSGKSTLLRLLAGLEPVSSGTVSISHKATHEFAYPADCSRIAVKDISQISACKPVILDRKPDCYDRKRSVLDHIILSPSYRNRSLQQEEENAHVNTLLAEHFAYNVGLTSSQIQEAPCHLSPSGQYMFGLACSCMQSVNPCLESTISFNQGLTIPGPILFLDELFDFEHSDIPRKVAPGLVHLCEMGAIVVAATHKPNQMKQFSSRSITMSAGRILNSFT